MRVGFIGLGRMGSPMAANIAAAGFEVVGFDSDPTVTPVAGVTYASTAREAANDVSILITMLPGPAEIEAVMSGPDGALAAMSSGSTWIDMSSSDARTSRRVLQSIAPSDVNFLDAPVTGGVPGAQTAMLTVFVGGESSVLERVRPVLTAMAPEERILHVGQHGAGYAVKLCVNLLFFMHAASGAEVLTLGVKAGVDLGTLHRCLVASGATSAFLERDLLSVFEGDYRAYFRLALACKDMGLAVDLGREVGLPLEVAALVEQINRRALSQYGDGGQLYAVRLMEDLAGTPLRLAAEA